MGALAVGRITVEEYFAMAEASDLPLEYHDGEVFPRVEATLQHAIISVNASRRLAERLDGSPCIAAGNLHVRTSASNYVIPDITVVCGGFTLAAESKDAATNPKVIVEILSPTTADFDHGGKFALYCQLPSFTEYVLIAQDAPNIEVFFKVSDVKWILTKYDGIQSIVKIESLGIEIPASEIYQGVEFPASRPGD
jgi:Uma2 family endonuclease